VGSNELDSLKAYEPKIKEYVFEIQQVAVKTAIAPSLLFSAEVRWEKDVAHNVYYMLYRLFIPSKTHDVREEKVPRKWYDHLLHDYPKLQWLFMQKPKYRTIRVSETRVCPHIDIALTRDAGHHFRFLEAEIPPIIAGGQDD
jgi:hypothetical protein